jgi:hypothetical protein
MGITEVPVVEVEYHPQLGVSWNIYPENMKHRVDSGSVRQAIEQAKREADTRAIEFGYKLADRVRNSARTANRRRNGSNKEDWFRAAGMADDGAVLSRASETSDGYERITRMGASNDTATVAWEVRNHGNLHRILTPEGMEDTMRRWYPTGLQRVAARKANRRRNPREATYVVERRESPTSSWRVVWEGPQSERMRAVNEFEEKYGWETIRSRAKAATTRARTEAKYKNPGKRRRNFVEVTGLDRRKRNPREAKGQGTRLREAIVAVEKYIAQDVPVGDEGVGEYGHYTAGWYEVWRGSAAEAPSVMRDLREYGEKVRIRPKARRKKNGEPHEDYAAAARTFRAMGQHRRAEEYERKARAAAPAAPGRSKLRNPVRGPATEYVVSYVVTVDHPELRNDSFRPVPAGKKLASTDRFTSQKAAQRRYGELIAGEDDFGSEYVSSAQAWAVHSGGRRTVGPLVYRTRSGTVTAGSRGLRDNPRGASSKPYSVLILGTIDGKTSRTVLSRHATEAEARAAAQREAGLVPVVVARGRTVLARYGNPRRNGGFGFAPANDEVRRRMRLGYQHAIEGKERARPYSGDPGYEDGFREGMAAFGRGVRPTKKPAKSTPKKRKSRAKRN